MPIRQLPARIVVWSALALSCWAPACGSDAGGTGNTAGAGTPGSTAGSAPVPSAGAPAGAAGAATSGGQPAAAGGATAGAATGGGNGPGSTAGSSTGGSNGSAGSASPTGGHAGSGTAGSATGGNAGAGGTAGAGGGGSTEPADKTVRVFWLRPSDVPFDQKFPDGIGKVMVEAQSYYKKELGKTFKLNTQIVETVVGEHVKSWYENTDNGGDQYWYSVFNMRDELVRRFKLKQPDSRWMIVGEVHAEGPGAGGGGNVGWVMLCQHDADGAAGIGGTINRWYGGMVHELGHAFGLPDAAATDGTPMSASLYDYPNTHFSQAQKTSILNGPTAGFLF